MFGLFNKKKKESLNQGLDKSKQSLLSKISRSVIGKSRVDQDVLDDLEEVLIESDVGVETTLKIIEGIEQIVKKEKFINSDELNIHVVSAVLRILEEGESLNLKFDFNLENAPKPYVVMVVGVNGVGKTTIQP